MKKIFISFMAVFFLAVMLGCKAQTEKMIVGKWDCVTVENLPGMDMPLLTAQDSLNMGLFRNLLLSLNWTFNSNGTYVCATGSQQRVSGTYLIQQDKNLICTPDSKKTVNQYSIKSISESDMVLVTELDKPILVLHFKAH